MMLHDGFGFLLVGQGSFVESQPTQYVTNPTVVTTLSSSAYSGGTTLKLSFSTCTFDRHDRNVYHHDLVQVAV